MMRILCKIFACDRLGGVKKSFNRVMEKRNLKMGILSQVYRSLLSNAIDLKSPSKLKQPCFFCFFFGTTSVRHVSMINTTGGMVPVSDSPKTTPIIRNARERERERERERLKIENREKRTNWNNHLKNRV